MFHVNASDSLVQFLLVCILTVVAYMRFMVFSSKLPFTVYNMFIAHATELAHWSTSMHQRPCPFRICDFCFTMLPCCSVLMMISSDLSYRDRTTFTGKWCFFLQFLTEKNAALFSISGICDINKKERNIAGVAYTLLDIQNRNMQV